MRRGEEAVRLALVSGEKLPHIVQEARVRVGTRGGTAHRRKRVQRVRITTSKGISHIIQYMQYTSRRFALQLQDSEPALTSLPTDPFFPALALRFAVLLVRIYRVGT